MTTAVTINAHAGWPVEVILVHSYPDEEDRKEEITVQPHTERTVYVHSNLSISSIRELPMAPTFP